MPFKRAVGRQYQKALSTEDNAALNSKWNNKLNSIYMLKAESMTWNSYARRKSYQLICKMISKNIESSFLLLFGAVYGLQTALANKSDDRHGVVLQIFGMIQSYMLKRKSEACAFFGEVPTSLLREVWYNLGRGYHDISLFYLAQPCYIRAITGSEEQYTLGHLISTIDKVMAMKGATDPKQRDWECPLV